MFQAIPPIVIFRLSYQSFLYVLMNLLITETARNDIEHTAITIWSLLIISSLPYWAGSVGKVRLIFSTLSVLAHPIFHILSSVGPSDLTYGQAVIRTPARLAFLPSLYAPSGLNDILILSSSVLSDYAVIISS